MAMDAKAIFKSPILLALSISIGLLLQFGAPSSSVSGSGDEIPNYPLLFMALITSALAFSLLTLRLTMSAPQLPNSTSTRFIDHLNTTTLAACFTTVMLALPEASLAFVNSSIFPSNIIVAWASQGGLIVLAIALLHQLISGTIPFPCRYQQCTRSAFFTLSVALGSLYTEPWVVLPSTLTLPSYSIFHLGLVPCGFLLSAILLIVGVTAPDNSQYPIISVTFKEVLTKLNLTVGIVILLIPVSFGVYPLIRSSAVVGLF